MSSLQLQSSPLCPESDAEDDESDADEICMICKQWCLNLMDFEVNFISCNSCPHSYHKRCIPIIYHSEDNHLNCYEMRAKETNKRLQCCSARTKPKLLTQITTDEFEHMKYFYDPNHNPIYYRHDKDTCNLYNAQTFMRTQCRGIQWKGATYHIGDSIEINQSSMTSERGIKVAMIKKIYNYNEPNKMPNVCVFWYRKSFETHKYLKHKPPDLNTNHNTKRNTNQIYLEIESGEGDIQISITSVLHKVLVCDDLDSFDEASQCNFKEFGNVYYCRYSFTKENYTKYKSSPFEEINVAQISSKINVLSRQLEAKYNAPRKGKERHKVSKDKVREFLNYYRRRYVDGEDEYPCFDVNVPFALKPPPPTKTPQKTQKIQKKQPKPTQKKQKKQKKIVGNENAPDLDKMRQICTALGISKGVHIDIQLYGFKRHVDVYKELMNLVEIDEEKIRNGRVSNMTTSQLRDIKSKIRSEGKTGKKAEMVCGIIKKLKEFQVSYENCNLECILDIQDSEHELVVCANNNRKRKRKSLFNNNTNRKKRRLI
eukprot:1146596_1